MLNLVFDLNNMVHRSLFAVSGFGAKSYSFDNQSEVDQLVRKIATDITFMVRTINPTRVILAKDHSSWRKIIEIEENDGYKASRKKTKMINWDNVYNAVDEFCKISEANGMLLTSIQNAEADDIIALWANELTRIQSQHVIIVSGDQDLTQLVSTVYSPNGDPFFIAVYNPFLQGRPSSKRLFVPAEFLEWLNTIEMADFMNMKASINVDKDDFRRIVNDPKTKVATIDGNLVSLSKIFCGDDGDEIPAMYSWLNNKGKIIRITNSKFEKILSILSSSLNKSDLTYTDVEENPDIVLNSIAESCGIIPNINIVDRIDRQLKLVVLDSKYFPNNIVLEFEKLKAEQLSKPRSNFSSITMYTLLAGTQYLKSRETENESSIFRDIDKIINASLF